MADQLSIYNGALLACGERFASGLTEVSEARRLLDFVWANGGVKACLEEGQWHFATRTVQLDYDPAIEPTFGYNRAFDKPSDWVLTCAVCSDEFFRVPLTAMVDEAGYWYASIDTIYVRYVSQDANYGMDMNKWPETFRQFVEAHFASRIILKLSNDEEEEKKVFALRKKLLGEAKNRALMAEPTMFPAQGSWSRARNRFPNRRDGGNSSGPLLG